MSDLTRKQIEEARGLGRDRLTNSEWLQLCDMALRTLDAEARADRLQQEAEIHAQEARTANATLRDIYQLCTGATGEPGNWNGAEPVRRLLARADQAEARIRELEKALRGVRLWLNGDKYRFSHEPDEVAAWEHMTQRIDALLRFPPDSEPAEDGPRQEAPRIFDSLVQDGMAIGLGQLDYTDPEVSESVNRKVHIIRRALTQPDVPEAYQRMIDGKNECPDGVDLDECFWQEDRIIRRALSEPAGEVVVTTNERGDAVAVTRQNEEGEILSVIWERDGEPAVPESVYQSAVKGREDFRAALRQERDKLKAVRRLPEHWRRACSHWQCAPGADSRERTLLTCADELDRALAQRGEQGRVRCPRCVGEGGRWIRLYSAQDSNGPMWQPCRKCRGNGYLAAAPQPQEGESDG